jgi:hypothetical protein
MKVLNVVKNVSACVLVTMLVGCASGAVVAKKMVGNTDKSGVIYGFAGVATDVDAVSLCKSIGGKDPRCINASDYYVVPVHAKFGFADGSVGIHTLVKKDFPNINALKHSMITNNKNIPFVKAKVIPGQLGEMIEIVSVNGDGKCYWSGMPRAGGTVCPAYGYDYRKDFIGIGGCPEFCVNVG